jgi:hypothetical protein
MAILPGAVKWAIHPLLIPVVVKSAWPHQLQWLNWYCFKLLPIKGKGFKKSFNPLLSEVKAAEI